MTYNMIKKIALGLATLPYLAGNASATIQGAGKEAFAITPDNGKISENLEQEVQKYFGKLPNEIFIYSGLPNKGIEQLAKLQDGKYALSTKEAANDYLKNAKSLKGEALFAILGRRSLKITDGNKEEFYMFKPQQLVDTLPILQTKNSEKDTVITAEDLNNASYAVFNVFTQKDNQSRYAIAFFDKNNKTLKAKTLGTDLGAVRAFLAKVRDYGHTLRVIKSTDQSSLFKTIRDKYQASGAQLSGADTAYVIEQNGDGKVSAGDGIVFMKGNDIVSAGNTIDDAVANQLNQTGKVVRSTSGSGTPYLLAAPSCLSGHFMYAPMPEDVSATATPSNVTKTAAPQNKSGTANK